MGRPLRRWQAAVAVGALAALGLVACGGGGGSAEGSGGPAERAAGPEAPREAERGSYIPEVTVSSGNEFALGSLVPSDRPVLVWFWAPH